MKQVAGLFLCCLFYLFFPLPADALPTAKVTIKAFDEDGTPIEDVNVKVFFKLEGYKSNTDEGRTNENGEFEASGSTTQYVGGCSLVKEGFYKGFCGNYNERSFTGISGIKGFRRWQPWNPTITIKLKRIKNPIPLYVRDIRQNLITGEFPVIMPENEAGFDLIASDWVAPYGSGVHADIVFQLDKNHPADNNFRDVLTVRFPNNGDGIQSYDTPEDNASVFKMPYHAPDGGYEEAIELEYENVPGKIFVNPFARNKNYFFRIRTQIDEDGNVVSALYGKIEGSIKFGAPTRLRTAWLEWNYFLNPTPNDTNLEFDESRNLFGGKFLGED